MAIQTQITPEADTNYRWTRQHYERMIEAGVLGEDDRVELLNGRIIEMSPQGSRHYTLLYLLEEVLEATYSKRFMVRNQAPLAMGFDSEPEPGISVVDGRPRDFLDAHPQTAVLAIEVADSSLMTDRMEKADLYAVHGIGEYWILNVRDEVLEVYRDPADGTYQTKTTLRHGDHATPPQAEGAIDVADVLP